MKDEIIKILKRYIDTSVAKKGGRFIPVDDGVYETEFPLIASQIIDEVIIPQKKEAFEAGRQKEQRKRLVNHPNYPNVEQEIKRWEYKYLYFEDYLNQRKDE